MRYYHKTANLANFPVIETDPSSLIVQIYAAKFPTSQDYSVSDRKQIGHGIYLPQYEYVLTNKHVLAETGYNYRLDPEDKQAELINIRYHPAQDLALAKLISSIETG
ncbi:MAG: hypothetical protein H6765_06785 [Candidatus Peribacteria bacterium]|nr:MAG: hypothetical protein H6765_06785 [Candidatus Peribacteria bacterium]